MTDNVISSVVKDEPQNYIKNIMKDTLNGKKDKNQLSKNKKKQNIAENSKKGKYKKDNQTEIISGKGRIINYYV